MAHTHPDEVLALTRQFPDFPARRTRLSVRSEQDNVDPNQRSITFRLMSISHGDIEGFTCDFLNQARTINMLNRKIISCEGIVYKRSEGDYHKSIYTGADGGNIMLIVGNEVRNVVTKFFFV